MKSLNDPVQYIKGVGPKRALLLNKLDLHTAADCLYFLPHRYEDRSRVRKISELVTGEQVTLTGEIADAGIIPIGRRKKIFELLIQDDTGTLVAKWFHFNPKYMEEKFTVGSKVVLSGKPGVNKHLGSGLEMMHPDIEISFNKESEALEVGRIVPVYSATEGLHIKTIRNIMKNVADLYSPMVEEFIPEEILKRNLLPLREESIRKTHFPEKDTSIKLLQGFKTPEQTRLIFEELFLLQLALAYKRKYSGESVKGIPFKTRGETIKKFAKLLQFELTSAQKRVLGDIMDDLEKDRPMNRLLHGDVGSGKTIVALATLLTAVDNGYQGALMAPTELLSEQHYLNLKPYCGELGIRLDLVTSAIPARDKKILQKNISEGKTHIVVGTHAIIQKDVQFHKMGLAVIDEQHRFGVRQREAIGLKGDAPHVLVMTATPIPRSLAMTLYGDMDVSVLDEMPPGRQPISTRLFYENKRANAYQFLKKEIANGRQAYVVCPLIEESDTRDLKTVIEVQEYLQSLFPEMRIELVHGRMKKEDRQKIMSDFKDGKINILVATTVIEVGIDIPNATLMIIEHAERFGLSQLHQLRGRVGRGKHSSHCLLIAYHPLSDDGEARLKAMLDSCDGFKIAEEDLSIRGPGDLMGTRQSGLPTLKIADLIRDIKIIESARKEAFALIDRDPDLNNPEHQKLKHELHNFAGDGIDLMNIL